MDYDISLNFERFILLTFFLITTKEKKNPKAQLCEKIENEAGKSEWLVWVFTCVMISEKEVGEI